MGVSAAGQVISLTVRGCQAAPGTLPAAHSWCLELLGRLDDGGRRSSGAPTLAAKVALVFREALICCIRFIFNVIL